MRRRQAEGVRALADYIEPVLTTRHDTARLALVWGLFMREGRREDFSLRKIADEYGLSKSTLGRDQQVIGKYQKSLEDRAIRGLNPYFLETGLLESYEIEQSA